ncbi:MAG: alginate lyase family protein [Bacteroidota bacterium]|nr:alginate lyase family protein [Bacteroidota bacterium]
MTNKTQLPASGDKHDYMSLAPYFWPNPNTPNGLPYIRKDGERNPAIKDIKDKTEMGDMTRDVEILSLAYYFSGNEKYADRATFLIRTWFLSPETRMNPNVNFGQAVSGKNDGRGEGVLETRGFIKVTDAIGLIRNSKAWTSADETGMKIWISEFLNWMQTSPNGIAEMKASNNHGVWYDAQRLGYALFLEKKDLANEICKSAIKRLDEEMVNNGSFPKELARTTSLGYSLFVMNAFFQLATLSEKTDINLWTAATPSGKSLKKGVDFLLPYLTKEKQWTGKQIKPFNYAEAVPFLMLASQKMNNSGYSAAVSKLNADKSGHGFEQLVSE